MADMKQYIISFQATLQGHKMVLTQLKGMERQMTGVRKVTEKSGKAAKTYSEQLGGLVKRAMMVIPVWLVLRAAMMTIMRTFGDMVRAFIDLDDQLARIRTVMHGTADVINAEMAAIKRQIIDTSLKSRIAIKDLAEGFYFLKTANLDATEAMAAFNPTVNLAIGTMNSMAESARAVAGIYNTMGQYLDESLTIHEKFQHIADVLAYTYSTQDVQLSELIQSYTKLAPYVTGLSDSFLELTTMLGFLNTRLLRGGRTGRLTGRAILQLTKNSEKLAKTFGITFDPDKPIAFLDTIKMIRDAMGKTGKVTAEQGQIIQEVFATRGGVAIRLLIEHFDDLSGQIKDAVENADGFAKKMKELRMDTIAGQMARMKNVLAVLMDDFLTTAAGAESMADAIGMLVDSLEALRPIVQGTGTLIAWLGAGFRENYYQVRAFIEVLKEVPTKGIPLIGGIDFAFLKRVAEVTRQYRETDIRGIEETQKAREKIAENIEKEKTLNEELLKLGENRFNLLKQGRKEEAKAIKESMDLIQEKIDNLQPAEIKLAKLQNKERELNNLLEKEGIGYLDKIEQKEKSRLRIMKLMGASTLDIAKAELEILENRTLEIDRRKEGLELLKAQLKVTEEEIKYRQQITDVFLRSEIDLLKAAGASEMQILEIREKQIRVQAESKGIEWEQLELLNLRIQQQDVLLKRKAKEVDAAKSLVLAYEKADKLQKGRIRRALELTALRTDEIVERYKKDAFDRNIILDYWSSFRKEAQDAILGAVGEMRDLEMPRFEAEDLLPDDRIIKYAQRYREEMFKAVDDINARFQAGMPTFGAPTPVGAEAPLLPAPEPEIPRIDLRPQRERIEEQLEYGRRLKEEMARDKEFLEKQAEANLKLDRLIEVAEQSREDTVEGLDKVEQANKETGRKVGEI